MPQGVLNSHLKQRQVHEIVTNEAKDRFDRDGVVLLKQALHPEFIRLIDLGIERVLKNDSPYKFVFYAGTEGEFMDATRNYDVTPEFRQLLAASPIADILGRFMDSENVWLLFDHVFAKEGGQCNRTPWHQDVPYWPVKGDQLASMWISLDRLSREECLEFVAGSHRGPMYDGFDPSNSDDPTAPLYGEAYPRLPDIEAERDKWNIVSWDVEPGDVIVFHPMSLHGGGPTVGRRRRALSVRCYGDDVVYDTRPGDRATAPPTPGLSLTHEPGDPLRSPYYPQLRPRQDPPR